MKRRADHRRDDDTAGSAPRRLLTSTRALLARQTRIVDYVLWTAVFVVLCLVVYTRTQPAPPPRAPRPTARPAVQVPHDDATAVPREEPREEPQAGHHAAREQEATPAPSRGLIDDSHQCVQAAAAERRVLREAALARYHAVHRRARPADKERVLSHPTKQVATPVPRGAIARPRDVEEEHEVEEAVADLQPPSFVVPRPLPSGRQGPGDVLAPTRGRQRSDNTPECMAVDAPFVALARQHVPLGDTAKCAARMAPLPVMLPLLLNTHRGQCATRASQPEDDDAAMAAAPAANPWATPDDLIRSLDHGEVLRRRRAPFLVTVCPPPVRHTNRLFFDINSGEYGAVDGGVRWFLSTYPGAEHFAVHAFDPDPVVAMTYRVRALRTAVARREAARKKKAGAATETPKPRTPAERIEELSHRVWFRRAMVWNDTGHIAQLTLGPAPASFKMQRAHHGAGHVTVPDPGSTPAPEGDEEFTNKDGNVVRKSKKGKRIDIIVKHHGENNAGIDDGGVNGVPLLPPAAPVFRDVPLTPGELDQRRLHEEEQALLPVHHRRAFMRADGQAHGRPTRTVDLHVLASHDPTLRMLNRRMLPSEHTHGRHSFVDAFDVLREREQHFAKGRGAQEAQRQERRHARRRESDTTADVNDRLAEDQDILELGLQGVPRPGAAGSYRHGTHRDVVQHDDDTPDDAQRKLREQRPSAERASREAHAKTEAAAARREEQERLARQWDIFDERRAARAAEREKRALEHHAAMERHDDDVADARYAAAEKTLDALVRRLERQRGDDPMAQEFTPLLRLTPTMALADILHKEAQVEDVVVLRLNAAGHEQTLLHHLAVTGALRLVDEVFVVCRNVDLTPLWNTPRTAADCQRIVRSLRAVGVYAHEWYE